MGCCYFISRLSLDSWIIIRGATNHPPEHHFYLLLVPRVDQKCPSGCFKGSAVRRLLSPNCLAETTGRFRPEAPEMAVQSQNRCLSHSRRHARTTNSDNLSVLARVSSLRVDSSPIWTKWLVTSRRNGARLVAFPPQLALRSGGHRGEADRGSYRHFLGC